MFEFYSPYFLLLFLFVPIIVYIWERKASEKTATMRIPDKKILNGMRPTIRSVMARYWYIWNLIVLSLFILAMARPREGTKKQKINTEGIDIVLVMDVSTSMKAIDFKPQNRLVASRKIAGEFVDSRHGDRIGLVAFGKEAFTQCPLTIDYEMVRHQIEQLQFARPEWDGTAIGNAIGTAVERLRYSKSKSKVIILLTDGRNNAGEIDPETAAELAKTFDIRLYTIGVGSKGEVLYPAQSILGKQYTKLHIEIDDELLQKIATITGGKYFRATNTEGLREVYQQISKMEKSKVEIYEFINYRELYPYFLFPALIFFLLGLLIEKLFVKIIPE